MVEAKSQRARYKRWFLWGNLLFLLLIVSALGREYVGNIQVERQIATMEAERSKLEGEKLATLGLITKLSSEYYLETEARTKQGLGKAGETLVVIQDPVKASGSIDSELQGAVPNPLRWYYYFFDSAAFENLASL